MERMLRVGQHLVFVDEDRMERDALVTAIHGDPQGDGGTNWPCLNLVFVTKEPGAQDQYGRQTVRSLSAVHWKNSSAVGYCWRFVDEEMTEGAPTIS